MDEGDFPSDAKAKVVTKRAYWWLVVGWFVALLAGEMLLALAISIRLHFQAAGFVSGSGVATMVAARKLADVTLRRRGRSRSGATVEVWANAGGVSATAESVAVPYASFDLLFGVGVVGVCLFLPIDVAWVVAWVGNRHDPAGGHGWLGVPLLTFLGLGGAHLVDLATRVKPMHRIDAAGVAGQPTGFGFRSKFVPWSVIATCAISTDRDPFGAITRISPTFADAAGRPLLTLDLSLTSMPDQERIARAIRAHLPKAPRDAWE